jgi:voltage-gated potassium channel
MSRFMRRAPTVRAAAAVIVTTTTLIALASAALMRVLDPKDFPNIWLALWWALQTVTTVGYGDVVPKTSGGRIVGVVVMLEGIAFLAVITAAITSVFIARAAREFDRMRTEGELSDRAEMERRFDELERKLDQLLTSRAASSSTSTSGSSEGS